MIGLELIAVSAFVIAAGMTLFWAVSLPLRDVSIVDIWWGLGFVAVAWAAFASTDGASWRAAAMTAIVSAWGLRLGAHLLWRWLGHHGEDRRYAAMRRKHGDAFRWRSIYLVFALQGALMLLIAVPILATIGAAPDDGLRALDVAALAVFAAGLALETFADRQLALFKENPENEWRVLTQGLWAWSRHPNYFGETLVWWGIGLFAVSSTGALWTLIGPLLVTYLLLRVSGVPMQEHGASERRPGYANYAARTSAFVPLPPRDPQSR